MAKAARKTKTEKILSKRKSKRRSARATPETSDGEPDDAMTRCVALCQEGRWREAVLLCRQLREKAESDGRAEIALSLSGALHKIEYSLRRQMAAALVESARNLLKKEYLLDVG